MREFAFIGGRRTAKRAVDKRSASGCLAVKQAVNGQKANGETVWTERMLRQKSGNAIEYVEQ